MIIDSGYAENKTVFANVKEQWKKRNPKAKVKRVKSDTKGLIMYIVEE